MGVYKYDKTNDKMDLIAGGLLYADAPVGSIIAYGGITPPSGWLICAGQEINRVDYAELFSIIGTTFGTPSSNSKFKVPDLRESVPKGIGLTGNSVNHLDTNGLTMGEFIDDRIQSHLHSAYTGNKNGWIQFAEATPSGVAIRSQDFDYDNAFSVGEVANARNGNTTEVKAVGVNYIIKAKQVGTPADFAPVDIVENGNMKAVTSNAVYDALMNSWTSIWTGNVTVPSTDGIQDTLVSGLSLSNYKQVCLILGNTNGQRNPSRIIIDNVNGYGDCYGSYRRSSLYGTCWSFDVYFSTGIIRGEYTSEGWSFETELVQVFAR